MTAALLLLFTAFVPCALAEGISIPACPIYDAESKAAAARDGLLTGKAFNSLSPTVRVSDTAVIDGENKKLELENSPHFTVSEDGDAVYYDHSSAAVGSAYNYASASYLLMDCVSYWENENDEWLEIDGFEMPSLPEYPGLKLMERILAGDVQAEFSATAKEGFMLDISLGGEELQQLCMDFFLLSVQQKRVAELADWDKLQGDVHTVFNALSDRPSIVELKSPSLAELLVKATYCAESFEFRRRGYDVTALPKPAAGNTISWGSECFISPGDRPDLAYAMGQTAAAIKRELKTLLTVQDILYIPSGKGKIVALMCLLPKRKTALLDI